MNKSLNFNRCSIYLSLFSYFTILPKFCSRFGAFFQIYKIMFQFFLIVPPFSKLKCIKIAFSCTSEVEILLLGSVHFFQGFAKWCQKLSKTTRKKHSFLGQPLSPMIYKQIRNFKIYFVLNVCSVFFQTFSQYNSQKMRKNNKF